MDINAYRYIVALERYKTISATARNLYLTQPALTNYIKRIENELGVALIERGNYPVKFTPYGEVYLKYAKEIAELDKRLIDEIDFMKNQSQSNVVRVGITSAGIKGLINQLPKFQEKNPDIYVELVECETGSCEDSLLEGSLDITFIASPMSNPDLEYIEMCSLALQFVVPKKFFEGLDYDLTGNSVDSPLAIELDFLNQKPFIVTSPRTGTFRWMKAFFQEYEITPGSYVHVKLLTTGTTLCKAGYGIMALGPGGGSIMQLCNHPDVVFCTVKGVDLGRKILMVRNKKASHSEVAKYFWGWMCSQSLL